MEAAVADAAATRGTHPGSCCNDTAPPGAPAPAPAGTSPPRSPWQARPPRCPPADGRRPRPPVSWHGTRGAAASSATASSGTPRSLPAAVATSALTQPRRERERSRFQGVPGGGRRKRHARDGNQVGHAPTRDPTSSASCATAGDARTDHTPVPFPPHDAHREARRGRGGGARGQQLHAPRGGGLASLHGSPSHTSPAADALVVIAGGHPCRRRHGGGAGERGGRGPKAAGVDGGRHGRRRQWRREGHRPDAP